MASLGQINHDVEAKNSTGGGGITILADDVYELEITESDVIANSKGTGQNLNYKVQVAEGPNKGVWFYDGINNVRHESQQSQSIAQGQLRALAESCGLEWPLKNADSEVFHFRKFFAQVGSETYFSKKHNKDVTKNKIVKYLFGDEQPDFSIQSPAAKAPAQAPAQQPAPASSSGAPARSWQRKAS